MSDPAAATRAPAAPRRFRRTRTARLTSLVALLLFGAAVALRAAAGEFGAGFIVVTVLALAALAGSIAAWGDRFLFDEGGVTWENSVLAALAAGRGGVGRRRLCWRDVGRVQEHQPVRGTGGVLFLIPYRGRRMALDAIENFDEVRRLVEAAVGAGTGTGAPPGVSTPPADRPR